MTTPNKAGIYIHIPFCVKKCNYCAFLSGPAGPEVRQEYVNHLIKEIRLRSREVPEADTIYFGGGTPSLLTPEQIGRILEEVRSAFRISEDAEVTLEANPGTLTAESLAGYRTAGINRLSMGVQSMDDRRLRYLGRIHTAEEVRRDVKMAREAGFRNINLDLIFAIPGTGVSDALEDLEAIAALEPEHISFYSLQLEEGTSFFRDFEAGKLREVPDETDREMYHRGIQALREKGYRPGPGGFFLYGAPADGERDGFEGLFGNVGPGRTCFYGSPRKLGSGRHIGGCFYRASARRGRSIPGRPGKRGGVLGIFSGGAAGSESVRGRRISGDGRRGIETDGTRDRYQQRNHGAVRVTAGSGKV